MLYNDRAVASSAISLVYRLKIVEIFHNETIGSMTTHYTWKRAFVSDGVRPTSARFAFFHPHLTDGHFLQNTKQSLADYLFVVELRKTI